MPECKYLVAPDEFEVVPCLGAAKAKPAPRMLCAWATYHPDAVEALRVSPPWLVRNAVAGHQWRDGDCDRCPAFERGEPVEVPRGSDR
jgi:hypothetical protein